MHMNKIKCLTSKAVDQIIAKKMPLTKFPKGVVWKFRGEFFGGKFQLTRKSVKNNFGKGWVYSFDIVNDDGVKLMTLGRLLVKMSSLEDSKNCCLVGWDGTDWTDIGMKPKDLLSYKSTQTGRAIPSEFAKFPKVYGPEIAKAVAEYQGEVYKAEKYVGFGGVYDTVYIPYYANSSDF